jgi:hypothetical protein
LNLEKNLLHGGGLSNFWMVKIGVDFVHKLRVRTKCCHLSWILYKNILINNNCCYFSTCYWDWFITRILCTI